MKFSIAAAVTIGAVLMSGCAGNFAGSQSPAGVSGGSGGMGAAAARSTLHQPAAKQMPAGLAATIQVPTQVQPDETQAAAYCKQTGGVVEVRRAVYGSNGPSVLQLAGVRSFCQYTANTSGQSRVHILLSTLYTTKPTLAALAYIFAPPTGSCQGNPASCYCSYLGGSDQFGGTTGAGGGWFKKNSIDQTLEACIFPDMSSIDSWGLAYHANGIIRGIDLTTVMRYHYPGSPKR
ncbi:MAG TPA: hypothetical protein VIJ77_02520 [Candidatus Tumulicola sp.]